MRQLIHGALALAISASAFGQTAPATDSKVDALLNAPVKQDNTLQAVVLSSKSGDVRLQSTPGQFSAVYAFITLLFYLDAPDEHSAVRIADARPTLHLKIGNPKGRVYFVRLESNNKKGTRSLKIGHSGFGSAGGFAAPDPEWVVPAGITQESDGIWKITPNSDLNPGEYGVFASTFATGGNQPAAAGDIYDFGVDAAK